MELRNTALILFIFLFFLRIFEVIYLAGKKEKGEIKNDWITFLIVLFYGLVISSSISEFLIVRKKLNLFVSLFSFVLLLFRFSIKMWAVKTLGKFWSPYIEIRNEHKLIKIGPYKYMRHPVYLCNIIEILVTPLILNAYYTALTFSALCIPVIITRMYYEEKALIQKFGNEYIKYINECYAFIPIRKK